MNAYKIGGIIVTYNPDVRRFEKVVYSLDNQINKLVVVDNGSINIKEVLLALKNDNHSFKIKFIGLKQNVGLAKGLNIGIKELNGGCSWILTLDQDTIVNKDAIKQAIDNYKKLNVRLQKKTALIHLNHERFGNRIIDKFIFSSLVLDKVQLKHNKKYYKDFLPVKSVIQSGMLIKTKIAHKFKFMEKLFIDQIDIDYSYRVRKAGYIILETKKKLIEHELGNKKIVNSKVIHYENILRLHYVTRNLAYLLKKKRVSVFEYVFILILLYRRYFLVNGFSSIYSLIRLYLSATIRGFIGKLGKIKD